MALTETELLKAIMLRAESLSDLAGSLYFGETERTTEAYRQLDAYEETLQEATGALWRILVNRDPDILFPQSGEPEEEAEE